MSLSPRATRNLILGAIAIVLVILFWQIILAIVILSLCAWLGGGGGEAVNGIQPDYDWRNSGIQQSGTQPQRIVGGGAQSWAGSTTHQSQPVGNAAGQYHTYPIGSQWEDHIRRSPSNGQQNGVDRYYGGVYQGTYTNKGTYTYDPNHVTHLDPRS